MKKIIFTALLILSFIPHCMSMELIQGDFSVLSKERFLSVRLDFSQAIFCGKYNLQDYLISQGIDESKWKYNYPQMLTAFLGPVNNRVKNKGLLAVSDDLEENSLAAPVGYKKSRYTLFVTPITVNENGDSTIEYRLVDNKTNQLIGILKKSNNWGSLRNTIEIKMLDTMWSAGFYFGKYISKIL